MRRFNLVRKEDETGVSGIGTVAEGIEFNDGVCVLRWLTDIKSIAAIYTSIEDVEKLHGHNGKTVVEWIDFDKVKGCNHYFVEVVPHNHLHCKYCNCTPYA